MSVPVLHNHQLRMRYLMQARRLPVDVLTRVVRAVFEPNEYPASILRLYGWTPDEAIPDFYNDPSVFHSIHPSMADLAVLARSSGPEDFVKRHRYRRRPLVLAQIGYLS